MTGGGLPRLSLRTLGAVPEPARPFYDPRRLDVGIVHLGLGAFHRAHQATFTEDALRHEWGAWGICGVSQRSRDVVTRLAPQDGLFTLVERGTNAAPPRIVGVVKKALTATVDWPELSTLLASPAVRIVSLTVTEKGYRRNATSSGLALDRDTEADLAGGPPRTVVGQLVRGMQRRRATGAGGVSVVSCDNLPSNGDMLRRLVADFVERLPDNERPDVLGDWIAEHVTFPSTVVDRIVPAATPGDLAQVASLWGLVDEGVVVAEPFRMWVIEDSFAAGRPAWEAAGAVMSRDVAAHELVKLRMLNGAHSTLAYLGALVGHATIADAVADPTLREAVDRLLRDEVAPTITPPPGVDLDAYRATVLSRFANPALLHRTVQIAMDGSQKLPQRLLNTLRDRRAVAAESPWLSLAVAGWMCFVWRRTSEKDEPLPLDDPLAQELLTAIGNARTPDDVVRGLLSVRSIFGDDLPDTPAFRDGVRRQLERLVSSGVQNTIASLLDADPYA